MGNRKCCCGSTAFEQVDITPVGVPEKIFFTRCTQCGLVIIGSNQYTENKCTSRQTVLHLVREVLGNAKQ